MLVSYLSLCERTEYLDVAHKLTYTAVSVVYVCWLEHFYFVYLKLFTYTPSLQKNYSLNICHP